MRRASLLLLVLLLPLLGPGAAAAAGPADEATAADAVGPIRAQAGGRYQAPVPGAVLRPFVAPEHAYGPGHRGVDLEVAAGEAVRAAGGGVVSFAGAVAGARWVTVQHSDGIRTSYGVLAQVRVRQGQQVDRGEVLGTATGSHGDALRPEPGLHWSARRGETYLDPLTLLEAPMPRPTLVGEGGWVGSHLVVEPYAPYEGGSRFGFLATPSPTAERPGYALPPNHHHLIQVPGYASEGPGPVLDPDYLGYGPDDSTVLSYRGCEPRGDRCVPRPYGGQDTDVTIDDAAALLDEQLRAQQRAQPHRPVDLLGHSMGGDVITHYLSFVYDPADPGLPPVGAVGTVATPHGGSGIAAIPGAISRDGLVGNLAELALRLADRAGVPGADRLSLRSAPLARYGAPVWGDRPARDPDRLAELGIEPLEIAGSRDPVVGRTDAGSVGDAYVLPGGHGSVLETEAMYQTWYDHAAGRSLVPVAPRVGWGSDAISDAGRTLGTLLELSPIRSVTRAIGAGDAGRVVWESIASLVDGPEHQEERTPEVPMAPDAPLAPLDAAS